MTTRLAEFSYDQSLFSDQVRLLFGRLPVGQEFASSTLYCQFVSGICLNMSSYAWPRNSSIGYWPLASWGGRVTLKPTPRTYIKTGIFNSDPYAYQHSSWPWNGGWNSSAASGAFIPAEIGYASTLADKPFPNGVDIGGYLDTTGVNDALYNRAGQTYPLHHGAYRIDRDQASIYAQMQQMVGLRPPGDPCNTVLGRHSASCPPTTRSITSSCSADTKFQLPSIDPPPGTRAFQVWAEIADVTTAA